ncbi:hypothetical protein ABZZ20_11605 [Streptomyces sp. NPDC006430]|uniref:hypothetical protein n=1 Tax=Streptomyces sp. NPDC006430 TaxID=3154299 RepID=UPI0033BD1E82
MGGWEHTRHGRTGRHFPRRAVITIALSVLVAALFLCVRPGEPHAATTATGASATTATAAAAAAYGHGYPQGARAVCVSHDELPGCSPFSHVTPGVMPAPPPAVPVAGSLPDPVAQAAGGAPARPHGALARAPDLHALQVLRT